jgi:3-phosphoshikimate 1-carboxyvinyltransferase
MGADNRDTRGFSPASRVAGSLRPPGSKSEAQRALLAAALARGTTTLHGLSEGADVESALALVELCGVAVERVTRGRLRIRGRSPAADLGLAPAQPLSVGESGTLARLATACLAFGCAGAQRVTLVARGSLLARRSPALFEALERAGVALVRQNLRGAWPVELGACAPPAHVRLVRPSSSQEVSGLLIALAAHPGQRVLEVAGPIPSTPYVALTGAVLARFGATIDESAVGGETRFAVRGPLCAPRDVYAIEPDASSAAVLLAAACLSAGKVEVPGIALGTAQGDARIVEHLQRFGCRAERCAHGLAAHGFPTSGAELDLAGEPDLAPVLAAVAGAAALRLGAESRLTGLATLRGKESDRLAVLAGALGALGLRAAASDDALTIAPGTLSQGALVLDPRSDHRMAFAFALLGLVRPKLCVSDPRCVSKSWPRFWEDLESLGARAS